MIPGFSAIGLKAPDGQEPDSRTYENRVADSPEPVPGGGWSGPDSRVGIARRGKPGLAGSAR